MKKLIIILNLLTLSQLVSAQEAYLKAGFNYSTNRVSYNESAEAEADMGFLPGFNIGIGRPVQIGERTAIDFELGFSLKGNQPDPRLSEDSNLKLNYWCLGGFARREVSKSLFVFMGPELGILFPKPEGWEERLNVFDFGLAAGARWQFVKKFALDIRYVHGFLRVVDNENFALGLHLENGIQAIDDPKYQNSSIQISIVHRAGF